MVFGLLLFNLFLGEQLSQPFLGVQLALDVLLVFWGLKHSPYIDNLQWQCQPIKSLDCLLMPRDC